MSYFFEDPWFLLLKKGIRNQHLGPKCAYCYWYPYFWDLPQKEQGNITVYTNPCISRYL